MKKIISFVIVIAVLIAMSSCSWDSLNGYFSISTENQLKEFLESDSAMPKKAYLSKDISITSNGDSPASDQESFFVVKGNKTIDLNGRSIKATVNLTESSKNYVVQTWPYITGFALIQIDDGAKLTLKNGTVETEFTGTASNKDVTTAIDKYYFETIQNSGEFIAINTTITCKTDDNGVTTPLDPNGESIKSSISGVFNRNKVEAYSAGAELSKVICTVINCEINASNNNGEANSVSSWSNTETNVRGSILNAKGSDSSKGIFLLGHEHNTNNTLAYPYQSYLISLNVKNCSVCVDAGEKKARGIQILTLKERSENSICATLNNVSFDLSANTTNLIKVEDALNTSTASVKITGTRIKVLKEITAAVEFVPDDKNKASININGIPF